MSPLEGVAEKNATVERAETRAVFVARGRLSPAKVLYAEFSKDFRLLKCREERKFRTQGSFPRQIMEIKDYDER